MLYSQPVTDIIQKRFSCRTYASRPIEPEAREKLARFIASVGAGPFGAPVRFELVAATEQDRQALKGLGTYGFIKDAAGFIIGAMGEAGKNLEDLGYLMEKIILFATDIGLGTCWLGGSFTKSSFAKKISARPGESVPAVAAVGYIADKSRAMDGVIRRSAGADHRLPWEKLFFAERLGAPLSREAAGAYATPLDMVRLGPSASNRQPWRIVKQGNAWHLYLQRTPGYGRQGFSLFLDIDDVQRLDMGIAMCHFQLTADELGLQGRWSLQEPPLEKPDELTEYTASWVEE